MSTNGKEYKLLIKIAGAVDKSFGTSLNSTQKSLSKVVTKIDGGFVTMDKSFDKIMNVGKKCFHGIAIAATAAATAVGTVSSLVVKTGSEFESAFAGVKKTVDATESEFAALRQDIIDLSTVIPSTSEEIAGVMEIAGQLGIANDSLTEFTKTMINLGVSTNMTAEDASTALARFANIVSMEDFGADGMSNWERLGATIVDLGNNFATTEQEIVEMSYKLASTGHIVGLSEAQILALSTAMSAVGIKTEAGGSAMSKIFKKMQLAVETGSDALKDYASVAGMSAEQFSDSFREDAAGALVEFVSGLNNTERNGKSAVAVLDDMGLKEIRLSNMLLALANSSDVMTDALKTANIAWNEGTALAVEAGKRYETFDSRVQVLKNSLKETGIIAYDSIRSSAVGAVNALTEKLQGFNEYLGGSDGMSKWITNVANALPDLYKKVKRYGSAFLDFLEPVINAGKWFLKNPKVIVSAIAGIGAALATYKIASTISHIVTSIVTLTANPVTLGIMSVLTGIGLIASAYARIKMSADDSLEKHFGNISLSMKDIQRAAERILSTDSLGGLRKALDAFEDLDALSASLSNTARELDKLNWKINIGMDLTPDEQENYKQSIADFVENAEAYALQAGYAVSLNLEIAGVGETAASKVNAFYTDQYEELRRLGEKLNEAVTEAFRDGLLEIEEEKVIVDLQRQMANIEERMAVGEYEASLSLIGQKYAGSTLTKDSFIALQEELAAQSNELIESYESAYIKNYSAITAAYRSNPAAYGGEAVYNADIEALNRKLASDKAQVAVKAAQFQANAISGYYNTAYGDLIDSQISAYAGRTSDWTENPGLAWETLVANTLNAGSTIYEAIDDLTDNMKDVVAELQDINNNPYLNEQARSDVENALRSINGLNSLSGSWEKTAYDLADEIVNTNANNGTALYEYANSVYGSDVRSPWISSLLAAQLTGLSGKYDNFKAEPQSGSNVVYSPTIQFYGEAPNRMDLDDALRMSMGDFDSLMGQYIKNKRRLAY